MENLRFYLVEVVSQDDVDQVRLGNPALVGGTLGKLLVGVRDDQLLVFQGERPAANLAKQFATSASIALDVVALFAQRLPVAKVVRAAPGAWNFVIGTQLYVRLLLAAGGTLIAIKLLELLPIRIAKFRSGFAFLADLKALQLVSVAFLDNRCEALLSLQLPHAPKDILVGLLSEGQAIGVDGSPDIRFSQDGSRDAMAGRPQSRKDDRVVELVDRGRADEVCRSVRKPFLASGLRFVRRNSRSDEKTFAGSSFRHSGGQI